MWNDYRWFIASTSIVCARLQLLIIFVLPKNVYSWLYWASHLPVVVDYWRFLRLQWLLVQRMGYQRFGLRPIRLDDVIALVVVVYLNGVAIVDVVNVRRLRQLVNEDDDGWSLLSLMLLNKRPTRLDDATISKKEKWMKKVSRKCFTTPRISIGLIGSGATLHSTSTKTQPNRTEPNRNTKSKSNINEVPVVSDRVLRQRTVVLVTKPAGH